jgi:hypothetical protein
MSCTCYPLRGEGSAVTIKCDVFIDAETVGQSFEFLALPRIGERVVLPGFRSSDFAIVETVIHIATGALSVREPATYLWVKRNIGE